MTPMLAEIQPVQEQQQLLYDTRPGVTLVRGGVGSGKTTAALYRLRPLIQLWNDRRSRTKQSGRTRILVTTYNRSQRDYIMDLAEEQVAEFDDIDLTVDTFGNWQASMMHEVSLIGEQERLQKLAGLCSRQPMPREFLTDEVEYAHGRFLDEHLNFYLSCQRYGRGRTPKLDRPTRQYILKELVQPYILWKRRMNRVDTNDLSQLIARMPRVARYDIIVVDEAQELSANDLRALMRCANAPSAVTFLIDTAQRIYPRGWTWAEAAIREHRAYRLLANHRNTRQIAALAQPLFDDIALGDDGAAPDPETCVRDGPTPLLLRGSFEGQSDFAIHYLHEHVDLSRETVAFLHPVGWFWALKEALSAAGLPYTTLSRAGGLPGADRPVALGEMHLVKGLEFDHVIMLGLHQQFTPHGPGDGDATLQKLQRLFAMAITRARRSVVIGAEPGKESTLVRCLDPETYTDVEIQES